MHGANRRRSQLRPLQGWNSTRHDLDPEDSAFVKTSWTFAYSIYYGRAFGWLLVWGDHKQCCWKKNKHSFPCGCGWNVWISKHAIAESLGYIFYFSGYLQAVFPPDQFIPPERVRVTPHLQQHLMLSGFFILADSGGCIVVSHSGFNLPSPDD